MNVVSVLCHWQFFKTYAEIVSIVIDFAKYVAVVS